MTKKSEDYNEAGDVSQQMKQESQTATTQKNETRPLSYTNLQKN